MKKLLVLLICMILAVGVFPQSAMAGPGTNWVDGLTTDIGFLFDGGAGTADNPFIINSAQSLAQLAVNVIDPVTGTDYSGVYFKLGGNINLDGKEWTPIGTFEKVFSGSFDGGGYAVQNMTVNMPDDAYAGLFGYIKNAAISHLGVTDCDVKGLSLVGGLAGSAQQSISIIDCYTTGTVAALGDTVTAGDSAGGLLGGVQGTAGSVISGCASAAVVSGEQFIGGLIGYCIDVSSIIKSCATGNVSGASSIGGFIGQIALTTSDIEIVNCYAKGDVTAVAPHFIPSGSGVAGFIGGMLINAGLSIHNCYVSGKVLLNAEVTFVGSFLGGVIPGGPFAALDFKSCFFDKTTAGREGVGTPMDTSSMPIPGVDGLTTASMQGADALSNAEKMDVLDSGDGAPVSGTPIWYPHSADYPSFEQEFCTVTFDSQNAGSAASPASKQVALNAAAGVLPTEPVKNGFIFGGWYTVANGGGTVFTAETVVTGNITVYAKWTAIPAPTPTPTPATLSVSPSDNTIFVSGRTTLSPSQPGGTWQYDSSMLTLTQNADGSVTVTGLKKGTTTVTYTLGGTTVHAVITISETTLPATGQDFTLPIVLGIAAVLILGAIAVMKRKHA